MSGGFIRDFRTKALVFFLVSIPFAVFGSVVDVDSFEGAIRLGPYVDVFRDGRESHSVEEVTGIPFQNRFSPLDGPDLHIDADEEVWVRVGLKQKIGGSEAPRVLILEVGNYRIDEMQLFHVLDQSTEEIAVQLPSENAYRFPVFRLAVGSSEVQHYFLRMKTHATMPVPLDLLPGEAFRRRSQADGRRFSVVYGVLLGMSLFNLFIYFSLRDRVYLFYVTYIVSMLFYVLSLNGQQMSLFGISPILGLMMLWGTMGAVMFTSMVFVKSFLESKRTAPRLHHLLTLIQAMAVLIVVFGLAGWNNLSHMVAVPAGLAVTVFGLAVGIVRFMQGYQPAKYFLMAWTALLLGILTLPLKELGVLPQAVPGELGTNYGAAAEAILLSFALADRIRILRRQKEELTLSSAHYRKASLTDGLTGLFNLRYFRESLDRAIQKANSLERPLSLLMIDVDEFKRFNDAFGHQAGDEVLKRLAALMSSSARESDAPCRYGGEEFVLLLPHTTLEKAGGVAERLRLAFESQVYRLGQAEDVSVTISIGVAQLSPGDDAGTLIQKADDALYRAKHAGKNRVELEG